MLHCVLAGSVLAQRGHNPLLDEPSPPRRQSRPSLATVLEDPRLASLLLEDSRLSGLDAVNFEVRYSFPVGPGYWLSSTCPRSRAEYFRCRL